MSRSVERAARNEVTFRQANDDIDARRRELGVDGRGPYICECEEERCTQIVRLTIQEYAAARTNARRFIVVRGHELRSANIIEEHSDFLVIEKDGVAGEIAARDEAVSAGDGDA
jgi:hypothetical protein